MPDEPFGRVLLQTEEFRESGIYKVGELAFIPLYPHLHIKHGALVPQIAATMKEMRDEGLFEQYWQQVEQEWGIE